MKLISRKDRKQEADEMMRFADWAVRFGVDQVVKYLFYDSGSDLCVIQLISENIESDAWGLLELAAQLSLSQFDLAGQIGHGLGCECSDCDED